MAVRTDAHGHLSVAHPPPVPGFLVQAVLRIVQDEGLELPMARIRSGASPSLGEPADFSIPGQEFRNLLHGLSAAAGSRPVGLWIGERITEPNLHVFGPVITASRTMRDAFCNSVELCNSMRYTPHGRLEEHAGEARYVLDETAFGSIWEDIVISLCFHAARRFLSSTHAQVDHGAPVFTAYFARPTPACPDDYRRCFGGAVRFGADITGLGFPRSLLDLPRPGTDAALASEVREISARRLRPMACANTWSARVETALRGLGDLSHVDPQRLAVRWGISPRTLRRRLTAEGTSLAQVLERVRFDRARYYLQRTDASIARVAQILGYADATSFRRAFKRWSGGTPTAHRTGRVLAAPGSEP